MSYGVLIIFLSFSLCACKDFCVESFLQYPIDDCNSVTVICQHNADQSQKMGAKVYTDKNTVCDMLNENKNACEFSSEGNQFRFTLKNLTAERKKLLYYCKVYTIVAPVIVVDGGNFHLVPGCNVSCPTNVFCSRNEGFFSFDSPLTLALAGTVVLMCGYGVIITILYFRLRRSSEEPPMTYVPMQQKPKRRVKGNDNTEYMDMRKVQQQAGPIRDLNHNSPGINGRLAL